MNDSLAYSSDLRQIIEPDMIRYSFNTLGWYLIAGAIIISLISYGITRWRKYIKDAYRREALKNIDYILEHHNKDIFFEINRQLKITCIQLFGRREVAALHGEEWFSFLLSKVKKEKMPKTYNIAQFSQAIYNPKATRQTEAFNDFALFWIQNHHV